MTLKFPYSDEQEALWARGKTECLERYFQDQTRKCVKWLNEVKHSPQRRAKRVENIRKKLGKEILRRTLDSVREEREREREEKFDDIPE